MTVPWNSITHHTHTHTHTRPVQGNCEGQNPWRITCEEQDLRIYHIISDHKHTHIHTSTRPVMDNLGKTGREGQATPHPWRTFHESPSLPTSLFSSCPPSSGTHLVHHLALSSATTLKIHSSLACTYSSNPALLVLTHSQIRNLKLTSAGS